MERLLIRKSNGKIEAYNCFGESTPSGRYFIKICVKHKRILFRVFSRMVHAWYMLHNVLTKALTKSLDYSSYFYRQLLRVLVSFVLFCFVFPLEWLNSVLIFDTDEKIEHGENKVTLKWNMTQKPFVILSFWYCSSFRCSLCLFFTLCLQSEHCERLREQKTSHNVFFPFSLEQACSSQLFS